MHLQQDEIPFRKFTDEDKTTFNCLPVSYERCSIASIFLVPIEEKFSKLIQNATFFSLWFIILRNDKISDKTGQYYDLLSH